MKSEALARMISDALDEMKALNIQVLDVHAMTSIADFMIIASGRSDRHVRSLAQKATETAKAAKVPILGSEGQREGEWILLDLGDVIVHVMHPATRAYYQLEKLWSAGDSAASTRPGSG